MNHRVRQANTRQEEWMSRTMLALIGAVVIAACSGGDRSDTAVADSLNRDLQMAPVDTSAALNDQPSDTAVAPATSSTKPNTPPAPKPKPVASQPAAPKPSSSRSLAAGETFAASTSSPISSATNKVGETVTAKVANDVKDGSGRVVIPAGSEVTLRITAIKPSDSKSDNTGTLTLAATSVSINGTDYDLSGGVSGLDTHLEGRKVDANDAAKVGAGAAAGAVVGRVLGGSGKGAVIGGVIGGAVGAQRAVETKDRDVVLPAASSVTITLNDAFSRS
jgi:uncharacterized membrane protein